MTAFVLDERDGLRLVVHGPRWPSKEQPHSIWRLCREAGGATLCSVVEMDYRHLLDVEDVWRFRYPPDIYLYAEARAPGVEIRHYYLYRPWNEWHYTDADDVDLELAASKDIETAYGFRSLWIEGAVRWLHVAEAGGRRDVVPSNIEAQPPLGRGRYRCAGRSCELCAGGEGVEVCRRIDYCRGVYRAVVVGWGRYLAPLYAPLAAWFEPLPKPGSPEEFEELWRLVLERGVRYKAVEEECEEGPCWEADYLDISF